MRCYILAMNDNDPQISLVRFSSILGNTNHMLNSFRNCNNKLAGPLNTTTGVIFFQTIIHPSFSIFTNNMCAFFNKETTKVHHEVQEQQS